MHKLKPRQILSLFLAVTLLMDLPAVPLALAGSDSFHGSAQEFVLPQNRGNIEFRSLSKKPLQVILVQDAHGIPDAQRGLARVLDYAANHYGVSTVGVEGVSGPLTAEFFQAVPEQEKLKAILKEDLRRGELSGIVWEAIFGNPSVSYIGIEDHKLFNQGLSLYLQAQGQQASDLEWLQSFKSRLEEYKKGVYTPDLLKADQLTETLSEGYKNLGPFLIEMGKFLLPNEGSSVDLLRRWSLSLENDASESSADALRFADDLREKLENKSSEKSDKTAKRLKTLARHTQDFRTGVEDLGAFSHKLTRLKSRAGLDLAIPDSVQSAAAQHVQIMRIEGGFLQQELKNYIHEVYTALASTEELQRLVTLSDFVQTLQSLLKLEITRSDWNYLNELRRKIEWDQNEYSELDVTLFLTELEDRSNAARTFYLNAIDREKAMVKGISSMMLNGHGAPIGLVSGGFHTQGIRDYLDQKKISYVVVSPSIQTLPAENHYAEHMAGYVSWSRYLVPEQGILSFSKSFSRYIRDALISDEEDPQAFLNDWRLRLLSQTLQPSLQNSSSLSRSLELLNEVLESETGSGLNRWPWSDFTEFLDDMRRFGPNASAQGRQLAAPASTRPAEAVSAAVLSPEMVFTAGQIETWGSLPAGSLYHQTAVTQRRSEVRNAQLFQEEVIKKVSGTIDPSITIETKTNEKGQSELWLRHTAPYEEFRVQFTYRIIFSDTPVYRSSKYPKYSLEGETEKVNTLVVPKLADGEGWDKAALTVMGKMWRSMTIADPLLNMRFTTKGFKLAKYQKKAVHVLDQKVSLGGRSLGVMATATGKTVVAFKIAERQLIRAKEKAAEGEDAGAVIFLVNNIQVLSDAEASWHRMFEGHYTTSRIYEGTNDITGDIIFATPASLAGSERLENLIKNRRISMVIVDEVHHLPAETPKQIFRRIEEESINQNWKTGFLGLTATETRPDNESVIAFFGNDIHYEYPIKSGWRDGYLVKWKYQAGDLDINPEGVGPIIPGAEIYERYRALRYDKSRFKNLFKLYRREAKRVLIPKGLIISSKVQKAKDLAAYFRKRGVHAITLVGEDRTTDKVRFEHSYEAWKTGHWPEGSPYANDPVPEVVVGVDIFREGVDVPAINILMLWDDTNSTIEFVQSVGRGLRIAPFKNYISVIDTVGLFRKLSLLRYLGSLTIKRKRGGKKVGGIEDEDDTDELPEDDVGLDKNVSAAVNRYFDDIPSQLIYRFKRYENIPDSGFKKLDKWIAVRSRFAKVSVAVGEEDPEETALVTYLRNFSREYLLDSGRLTSEAIREFRERFAHVFDIDASLNTPAAKDFVMREESYLVYRRLGVLFHQADRRIDLKVLETIYPEFDEEHQRALRNRAENLQFFRKAILRLTPQEALDYGLTVLQKAKVDRLVYSDWLEAVEIGATTEDSIIYMAENPIKQGGSSILGGRLKNKAQYHQYSQEEVMQTYLTDPKYKELLTPDDFKLPHDAFVKLTREKLLLDDAKSLEIYLDQLGKAIQSYIAALRFEDQRAELPARRNDLTVLIQHEMFQRVVALELMTPELFKKWFDLYWAAYQEGRFQSGSEAVIHTWFTELASSLGFFFMLPIPGLSHINLQVYRGSYNTYEISLLQQTSIGTYAGRHSSELTVTPSGDIIFNTDGTDFESFFESLDGRAQGFITEELAAMVGKIYDVSAYQASRQVLVLAPNEAKLTLALRDFFFNQTDWDVFSESAMNASSPEERQKWRLTLFDHVPPGVQYIMVESSASDNPKQTKRKQKLPPGVAANLGVESAIYRTYVRYFNYWNYWRLQAEEGVRGIETRAEGKLPSESLLAKALPFIKSSLLRVIHDGTQGDFLDTNEFLPSAVTISDALGFYADQETISEERLRLANVYLFTLQRKARQYHGNKPYETFGKPFTTWKDVSTIRGTLANVISFYRQVYFAGIQVPASFEEKLDAYLTMVEEDSSRIQYKQQSAAISLLIEEMISKIKVGIPLSSDADDGGALALPAFSVPIYYDGQLQVVAHPKDPARPSVGSILHLDPSHSDIPKGGVAKLVAIDDADQFDTVCAVCFKAAFGDNPGLKQNVKGLRDYQDENVDSAEPISDDDYWTLGATLRSEVRLQNKSNQPLSEEVISTGIGDLFLTHLTDRPISKGARQRAQAILRSIPALQVVFNKVESVYQDGNRTAVLKSELASQASREMRDFMKSEFSDLAQSGQGVLFGIRIPDSSAASHGRIQTVVAFIQSFLPQSDLTYNHAIITGTADLPPMLRESLKSVGVHTASSRRVASLLGQYGQAIFPEVVLDSRFESKGLDVPARSVELRETQGETRDTETMAVELEAIHAFALARYGDGDALRSFYQRLSSSVSLFKQYPDILYSAIIQSSGNNRDYVDMSILSAYLNLLTAQLAATQQLAQSA